MKNDSENIKTTWEQIRTATLLATIIGEEACDINWGEIGWRVVEDSQKGMRYFVTVKENGDIELNESNEVNATYTVISSRDGSILFKMAKISF